MGLGYWWRALTCLPEWGQKVALFKPRERDLSRRVSHSRPSWGSPRLVPLYCLSSVCDGPCSVRDGDRGPRACKPGEGEQPGADSGWPLQGDLLSTSMALEVGARAHDLGRGVGPVRSPLLSLSAWSEGWGWALAHRCKRWYAGRRCSDNVFYLAYKVFLKTCFMMSQHFRIKIQM